MTREQEQEWVAVEQAMTRLDSAARAIDELGDEAKKALLEFKECFESFFADTLRQVINVVKESQFEADLRARLFAQPHFATAASLLKLVKPSPVEKVIALLDYSRPQLRLQGGDVEFLRVDGNDLVLLARGTLTSCQGEAIKKELAEVLQDRIGFAGKILFEDERGTEVSSPSRVKLQRFVKVCELDDLVEGRPMAIKVSDTEAILVKVDNQVACFKNQCAHQGLPLSGAKVCDGVITCQWHGFKFDALSGEGITIPGVDLEPLPVRVRSSAVQVGYRQ
jgi:nitrite reductase/ring-hydroxylating ferredoxin subunit/Fe-S cluster biogenesis protein NfuA